MSARLFARLLGKRERPQLCEDPVIVLGNQKSGTSAIAALLAELGGLSRQIDAAPLQGRRGHRLMRGEARFADVVRDEPELFAKELIKEPMMTFFVDQVREVFPRGRYVFVLRDPRDNIRSLLNSRRLPGDLEELTEELRASLGRRITVDPGVWGGAGENYVSVLAHRWNLAADAYLEHRNEMRLARYEDFVRDKQGFLESLARELGVELRNDVSSRLDVQFQPRGDREITPERFFGPANLARIERISGERMRALGYAESATRS